MTARTLFIHVGPPKTGTSAVQHFFRSRERLRVVYPRVGLWADGSHHNLVFNFYGDYRRPEVVRGDAGAMLEEIAGAARAEPGDLLISSEALAGRDVGPLVRALLACLGDDWQPEILVVCREHFERASSLYNQAVKDAAVFERRLPDAYLAAPAAFCYAPLIRSLRQSGFPVTALNYHPAADFVNRFLHHLGLPDAAAAPPEQRNVSLSRPALVATLAANNAARDPADRERSFAALRARLRPFYAPSGFIFGPDAAAAAARAFCDDRQYLRDEFGPALPAVDPAAAAPMFWVAPDELAAIAAATSGLGMQGEAIVDFARRFVQPRAAPGGF